eukprot:GHUV01035284.1.p1 GENE.GHUV01035284.1~~GHUV01035284.1.p1  ORF type:complete len:447 (+),score=170.33 GHUV01035284.1:36-1376(+)
MTCSCTAGDATYCSTVTTSSAADYDNEMYTSVSPQASSLGTGTYSRPMSRDVRGSRPNSAAIAAQIEGFENDFLIHGDDHGLLLENVPEVDAAQGAEDEDDDDFKPNLEDVIQGAHQEQAALVELNEVLQRKARQVLEQRNKGRPAVNRDLSRLDGADARYRSALKMWTELREERERVTAHNQVQIFEMKSVLEGRIRRAEDIAATFARFKREVCLSAEHSKTGRPVGEKVLQQLEQKERSVEEEVQRVRLKNIHLANALKKLEATLRDKEQLAEGLHMIDFEQLKIENQSLNEKIEERNEELIKLRKKTTITVQILTHMKEKLQFVEGENEDLQQQLQQLESELAGRRDELAGVKANRDKLRQQGRKIKETNVYVSDPMLLHDMQAQKERRDDLMMEIESLKQQYADKSATLSAGATRASTAGRSAAPGQLTAGSSRGKLLGGLS